MDAAIHIVAKVLTVLWFVGMIGCLTFIPIAATSWFALAVRDWFRGGEEVLPGGPDGVEKKPESKV
jgi:hypothetical protein